MLIVTGATGHLGKDIVRFLSTRRPVGQIVGSVRDPGKAAGLADLGVEVRHGDFAKPETLQAAFAGGAQVLIVSADKLGDEARALHRAAIDAARAASAGRILYTSHMGARPGSSFSPAAQHWETERDLEASGVSFTSLRHGFYAESCLHMIGDGLKSGELRVPADGPVSWTARADLAEADAAILASDGEWDGITPPLTATAAVTMAEIAAMASEVLGHEVRHTVLSDEDWVNERISAGIPKIYAEMLLGTFRAARDGDFAATDPTLTRLLGRDPVPMRDVLASAAL
ncbi:NAD(P)H-binding protein [Pseudoroseicyclus tamaricis]|uniref:NAD(P)H-binding protein n=1 Tax=Pseudoroseicyclus tamaricis TaxID=2705421 RepID=A0A6B2JZM4_9RHOB|nr:NAD(P)H-binding protein [Pseudoroseicyclus tamaricis]NDV00822.1 NAD(P)H-binding protein [Pseudoroseicyclus tamaricis]